MTEVEKSEKEKGKGLTVKALLIGIIVVAVYGFYTDTVENFYNAGSGYAAPPSFHPSYAGQAYRGYSWPNYPGVVDPVTYSLMAVFLAFFVLSIIPKNLINSHERTVIFAMVATGIPLCSVWAIWQAIPNHAWLWIHLNYQGFAKWYSTQAFSPFLLPCYGTTQEALASWYGKPWWEVARPWGAFLPAIFNWTIFSAVWISIFTFSGLLFRRAFTDVEDLPFPNATAAAQLVAGKSAEDDRPNIIGNKWLWIGFGVGLLMCWSTFVLWLTPKPAIELGKTISAVDLTPLVIIPWVPLYMTMNPMAFGFSLLMPLEVAISTFLWLVVFWWIIPPVLAATGIIPGAWSGLTAFDVIEILSTPEGPWGSWYGYSWIASGAVIGVIAWVFWRNRRQIFRRPTKEEEANEPLSYRNTLLGFAISLIAGLALAGLYGGVVWIFLVTWLIFTLYFIGITKVRAETGAYGGFGHISVFNTNYGWGALPSVAQRFMVIADHGPGGYVTQVFTTQTMVGGPYSSYNTFIPTASILECMKLGDLTGTRRRDILIAALIGPLVGAPIGIIARWGFTYIGNVGQMMSLSSYASWFGVPPLASATGGITYYRPWYWYGLWTVEAVPPGMYENLAIYAIAGAVIAFTLFGISSKFPRMPLTGVGFVAALMGVSMRANMYFVFFPLLISIIVKYFVMRTYGAKTFEEKMIPASVGLILAFGVVCMVDKLRMFLIP